MLVRKSRYGFEFYNYLAVTNEINSKILFQFTSFIMNTKCHFAFERYYAQLKFMFKSFLIQRLRKSTSQHIVNFHRRSNNIV